MVKLNIKQRYDLQKYTGLLLSTLSLRLEIEKFWQELAFTEDEYKQYNIRAEGQDVVSDDENYTIEIGEVSPVVLGAMQYYIEDNGEANAENPTFIAAKNAFGLVLGQ